MYVACKISGKWLLYVVESLSWGWNSSYTRKCYAKSSCCNGLFRKCVLRNSKNLLQASTFRKCFTFCFYLLNKVPISLLICYLDHHIIAYLHCIESIFLFWSQSKEIICLDLLICLCLGVCGFQKLWHFCFFFPSRWHFNISWFSLMSIRIIIFLLI